MSRLVIQDTQDFANKLVLYRRNRNNFRTQFPISNWDVSRVTDMSMAFASLPGFNEPLNDWDVSNVTNMSGMFWDCEQFNQPLNHWNVSRVTSMQQMFGKCESFNQPLDNWDVSHVTTMQQMFEQCKSFNQPLDNWDVSRVTTMQQMFAQCESFDQPLDNWDVSRVTNMHGMFLDCEQFNKPLNHWNVSRVTSMQHMFGTCESFNQPLDNWDVSRVTTMQQMFEQCKSFNQPLDNWDVSRVTTMQQMFAQCESFNQPLNNWDVSNVRNMGSMFAYSNFNQPLNNWNVYNCRRFSDMFLRERRQQHFIQDLSSWRIAPGSIMAGMFRPGFPIEFMPTIGDGPTPTPRTIGEIQRIQQEYAQLRAQEQTRLQPLPNPPLQRNAQQPQRNAQQPQRDAQQPQQGIAFQVHNKFDKLDLNALSDLIKSGPTLDVYGGTNLNQDWLTELRGWVQKSGNRELLQEKLSRISGKIATIQFAEPIHQLNGTNFFYTILNFLKQQPKEFQDNYVNFLIDDSCTAYDDGDTTSCVKGIKERMVLALGQAGYNLNHELYNQISSILFQVKDSQIFHFISKCLETNKTNFIGKPLEQKKQLLINCVNQKLTSSGEMGSSSKIMELIEQAEDMLSDDALTGGKRSNSRKRSNAKRSNAKRSNSKKRSNAKRSNSTKKMYTKKRKTTKCKTKRRQSNNVK